MKKAFNVVFISAFLLFLSGAMIIETAKPWESYAYYENRSLAEMPAFYAESALDGSLFSDVESALVDHAAGRNTALEAKCWFEMYVMHKQLVNETIILPDLLLQYLPYEHWVESDIEYMCMMQAESAAAIKAAAESSGGEYFFVAVPCQYAFFENEYPEGYYNRADFTESAKKHLFSALRERGVSYIDAGEELLKPEHREIAPKTDNHFGIEGAYIVYDMIMDAVDATREAPIPRTERTTTVLENHYLGSRARKLFDLSVIDEKLGIMEPMEEIPYRRWDWSSETESGARIYAVPDIYTDCTYSVYMGGDISETIIKTDRSDRPKILIYGDSFTNAVECLIWADFDEMRSLDFRYYDKMQLSEYIAEYEPDYVVCIRDYEQLAAYWQNGGVR